MSIARKTTLVHTVLAGLTLWPVVHIGLVWRYDLSPWKLAGWGMYTTPRFGMLGMEVYGHEARGDRWEQLTAPGPAVRAAAAAFLEHHRWLRRLTPTDWIARPVAAEHPTWDALRITVSYPAIDLGSGLVVLRTDERHVPLHPSAPPADPSVQ